MLRLLLSLFAKQPPTLAALLAAGEHVRSPRWPTVRRKFLEGKTCAGCGGSEKLEAHHKLPFHLRRDLELNPNNLICLCEKPGHDCHFRFGHSLDWKAYNPDVVEDAALALWRVRLRKYE